MVAKVLGVQKSTLFGWLALYRRGGWDALDARKRGGRPPKLTAKSTGPGISVTLTYALWPRTSLSLLFTG
ncbi:MAG: helix-turn-helix domain-containing protein [Chloroflexi bacterium]|nr:helix-turn-helix domain-containing protein [Chloroflexota bacterium]